MIFKDASLDELVEQLNASDFDAVKTVNAMMDSSGTIREQHLGAVKLMASLDQHSQTLVTELEGALSILQKSEKRLPHEIDLLKNDINTFHSAQSEKMLPIMDLARSSRQSPVFTEIAELQEVKRRIESVCDLLLEAQAGRQPTSAERAQQLAAVFVNTVDESKWAANKGYYEFINKIIK